MIVWQDDDIVHKLSLALNYQRQVDSGFVRGQFHFPHQHLSDAREGIWRARPFFNATCVMEGCELKTVSPILEAVQF